ncbi:hypothetical protein EDD11_009789 [Mortierella claussenii]|nr:hypothetical protein EDD11_009789 [Mortierella claussenii]
MPMQVFEFQADNTVSLVSPAAINRKSCDHCFLNRKTCDKVRDNADSGEKCKRCAKDNRPCTFTPTVHLYHIADCVGRHQCRAKVIQAMGGRKKEVQFKTIEIPIVCDMDSAIDQALFDFIQKQPNLLVYNNRIKSFLAQDMLGVNPDLDVTSPAFDQYGQDMAHYSISPAASPNGPSLFTNELAPYANSGNFSSSLTSPKYKIAPLESQQPYPQIYPQQQSYRAHPYAHQRNNSDDRGRQIPSPRPLHSPRANPTQSYQTSPGRISPLASPSALSPVDAVAAAAAAAASYEHRRHSENMAAAAAALASSMNPYSSMYQQQQQQQQQPFQQLSQQHPYAQQSPYPQPPFFHQPQAQLPQQQQQQQMTAYRATSPFPSSPLAPSPIQSQGSPQPPSPFELSSAVSGTFDLSNNGSSQNLPSLFGTALTMDPQPQSSPQAQPQQQHLQQPFHPQDLSSSSTNHSGSTSPSLRIANQGNEIFSLTAEGYTITTTEGRDPAPMVVTTTNEEGNEVGLYYAVPTVNLNPNASEADLFQDFTMMDDALGENFVWIENLFDGATATVIQDSPATSSTLLAIPSAPRPLSHSLGGLSSVVPHALSSTDTTGASMEGLMSQCGHHQGSFGINNDNDNDNDNSNTTAF